MKLFFNIGLAALGLVLIFLGTSGFGHYEQLPPECPDATWAPRPPPNPQVTRFDLNHAVIDDGAVRCYVMCLECTNPAIHCVVLP